MQWNILFEVHDSIKLSVWAKYLLRYLFCYTFKYKVNILRFIYLFSNDANIWNLIMDMNSTMNDSSPYSSSSDGLNFILEESSDDSPILDYVLNNETDIKTL